MMRARLPYCDADCYAEHCIGAIMALENHAMATYTAHGGSGN
jgi:hypothetical protein